MFELTAREKEVLYYISKCLTNKEIAEILHITHHTVKAHISSILYKLKCKNRTDAALYAEKNCLFTLHQDLIQP